jgi:hypothetical protein
MSTHVYPIPIIIMKMNKNGFADYFLLATVQENSAYIEAIESTMTT